jgi:pyruvate dehydrogenase E1 component
MRINEDLDNAERFETDDWISALDATAAHAGPDRARRLLGALERHAKESGLLNELPPYLPYRNTIALEQQSPHPGDVKLEERITSIMRWNALAMVVRANRAHGELGGHIASYASAAEIFEIGFNHFFNAASGEGRGDLIYFQPHSSPGVYARAFLEGRLKEENLAHYRQEIAGPGICS